MWWRNYCDNPLSRFDTIPERDGQTGIIPISISRVSTILLCWRAIKTEQNSGISLAGISLCTNISSTKVVQNVVGLTPSNKAHRFRHHVNRPTVDALSVFQQWFTGVSLSQLLLEHDDSFIPRTGKRQLTVNLYYVTQPNITYTRTRPAAGNFTHTY